MKRLIPLLFLTWATIFSGCSGGPVALNPGTAQGLVKGTVDQVAQRAQNVMQQLNVQVTGSSIKNSGNERQIVGRSGDTDVTITLDNAPNSTTNVEVSASKNVVSGNKDLAKEILSRIVQQS